MLRTGHYLLGLLMFGSAFAFTRGLASFLQQAALARQAGRRPRADRAVGRQHAAARELLPEGLVL